MCGMLKGSQYLCTARSLFSQFSGELVIEMHAKRADIQFFSSGNLFIYVY